eukprot:6471064-Amphidinium_carterae.2
MHPLPTENISTTRKGPSSEQAQGVRYTTLEISVSALPTADNYQLLSLLEIKSKKWTLPFSPPAAKHANIQQQQLKPPSSGTHLTRDHLEAPPSLTLHLRAKGFSAQLLACNIPCSLLLLLCGWTVDNCKLELSSHIISHQLPERATCTMESCQSLRAMTKLCKGCICLECPSVEFCYCLEGGSYWCHVRVSYGQQPVIGLTVIQVPCHGHFCPCCEEARTYPSDASHVLTDVKRRQHL